MGCGAISKHALAGEEAVIHQQPEAEAGAGSEDKGQSIYETYGKLNEAISGGENAPIVLLTSEYILGLHKKKEPVPCRQELPQDAKYTGTIGDDTFLVVLSYCWVTREHPDPECQVLNDVATFLDYLEKSRHWGRDNEEDQIVGDKKILLFWDFPSLFQNHKEHRRTADQDASFSKALGLINIMYAHAATLSLLCTRAYRVVPYEKSGWPWFEMGVSFLSKPADLALCLPDVLGFLLKKQSDSEWNRSMFFLLEHCRTSSRLLAASPKAFAAELENKTVTNGCLGSGSSGSRPGLPRSQRRFRGPWPYLLASAALFGMHKSAEQLLKKGVPPGAAKADGNTPLHGAGQAGHKDIVTLLCEHHASVNAANNDGATPLFMAAQKGHGSVVGTLLERRADPAQAWRTNGFAPLHMASMKGHRDVVGMLLERRADPAQVSKNGQTPFDVALQYGHGDTVGAILKRRTDLQQTG